MFPTTSNNERAKMAKMALDHSPEFLRGPQPIYLLFFVAFGEELARISVSWLIRVYTDTVSLHNSNQPDVPEKGGNNYLPFERENSSFRFINDNSKKENKMVLDCSPKFLRWP